MRRRRVQIKPVPEDVLEGIGENPLRVFPFLDELQIEVPPKAEYMLMCVKLTSPKLDIRFYKEQGDYLTDYTSCLLKGREDYDFHSFRKDPNVEAWEMFLPPPVIGLGIKSRLRPGMSST